MSKLSKGNEGEMMSFNAYLKINNRKACGKCNTSHRIAETKCCVSIRMCMLEKENQLCVLRRDNTIFAR